MCLFRGTTASAVVSLCLSWIMLLEAMPVPAAAQQQVQQQQQQEDQPPFRIVVLEGEGSINNVKQPVNRGALVLVEDENKNPLGGVAVTFFLPSEGPSGFFPNGSRVLTVFTDEKGLAATRPIRFGDAVGLMRIRTTASLFSQTANALITETNVSSASAAKSSLVPGSGKLKVARPGSSHTRLIMVLVAVGAAAGVGYYFATKKSTPTATIGVGTPSVGGPQ
jgi:hypothetical protein